MTSKRLLLILNFLWAAVALSMVLIFQQKKAIDSMMIQELFHPATPRVHVIRVGPKTNTSRQQQPQIYNDYAYAFVMAGCNPARPETYRSTLYSILVNAQILESSGSTADLLILVQMAHDTNHETLPPTIVRSLRLYPRMVIRYLPKPTKLPSSYEIQFYKFYILKYSRYRRVLYLDVDMMPLCSLDYLFLLSDKKKNGTLKENVALAGHHEPALSAFMMLRPGQGEFEQLMTIVKRRDDAILTSSTSSDGWEFDKDVGWGNAIQKPDQWRARYNLKSGRRWRFPSAFADQGLLYHWIKYVKMNASLFIGNEVENWSDTVVTINGTRRRRPMLESTVVDVIKGYECPTRLEFPYDDHSKVPYDLEGQMWHFWDDKPWMVVKNNKNVKAIMQDPSPSFRAYKMWFRALVDVKRRLNIGFDLEKELRRDTILIKKSTATTTPLTTTKRDMKKALAGKHAYAFLIAGVNPTNPNGYRGHVLGILANAQTLAKYGSQANIIILVQMHFRSTAMTLPQSDIDQLSAYPNIVIHYLPKPVKPLSFYDMHLLKFYILELTQYRRVLYLDTDVMLLCNMDYLFDLSENGVLKENIILAGNNEPAVGHFMMLRPGAGEYQQMINIVDERDKRILASSKTKAFNPTLGWGHIIHAPDRWRARYNRKSGLMWNFTAAYADQGLAYHWVKYVKQSVSIFNGDVVENWSSSSLTNKTDPVLESTLVDIVKGHECPNRLRLPTDAFARPPYDLEGQIWHFGGNVKPWMHSSGEHKAQTASDKVEFRPYQLWVDTLDAVSTEKDYFPLNVGTTRRKAVLWNSRALKQDILNSRERRYAYAYLIANCNPEASQGYRGLLYGILVNAQILDSWGSTADIVLLVQMTHDSTSETLPEEEMIKNAYPRIFVRYLPKPQSPLTFYEVQLQKFFILELFQYHRVLYMDVDVMPLCSLDYLFRLSDTGFLKDNVLLAGKNEPSNGGIMMLRPGVGEYQQLRRIIESRDARILESSPNLKFDTVVGWGHVIVSPDYWRTCDGHNGTKWDFSAAFCDQGLMYHWAKYVKKSVSIFVGNEVENWSSLNSSTGPSLEATLVDALKGYECPNLTLYKSNHMAKLSYGLGAQFHHFDGKDAKPWMEQNSTKISSRNRTGYRSYQMWFRAFDKAKSRLKMNLDLANAVRQKNRIKHWTDGDDFKLVLKRKGSML